MRKKLTSFAYICECAKKWVFSLDTDANTTWQCDCGRTIVVRQHSVYSPNSFGSQQIAKRSMSAGQVGANGAEL